MSIMSGIGLRLAATGLFSGMSVCVRLASFEAPVGQIMFFRSFVALAPILAYLVWRGQFPSGLRTERPGGHFMRALVGAMSMFFSFVSLAYLPLANATAIGFLAPLMVIPFAVLFLGERPGWIVIGATILGFLGIGLMLGPALSGPTLDHATLIGIGAGLAMAATTSVAKIQIKSLTSSEPAGTIALYFAIVCSLIGLATWPLGWSPATPTSIVYLAGAGLLGGTAHIAMTEAVARVPVTTLAPFEYTSMIWALALDLVIFGLLPTTTGLTGALLIVIAAATVAFVDQIAHLLHRWFGPAA